MPLWIPVGSLAGPGLNIGTAETPFYEATPVHAFAALAGIVLSVVVYVGLAYLGCRWHHQRKAMRAGL
jgi:hypothetical protein